MHRLQFTLGIFWCTMMINSAFYRAGKMLSFSRMSQMMSTTATTMTALDVNIQQNKSPDIFRDRFSVAPMMDYTDRHQRYLMRLLSKCAVLYTEMITSYALVHSQTPNRFLVADIPFENPLVLQLGGSDVEYMRKAAKLAFEYGYREFNINAGCPSEKVAGAGNFGASLMLNPQLVGDLVAAIKSETDCPVTVKCRIGVNDQDSYEELTHFIDTVHSASRADHFVVHARKAILGKKFTPAENRKIPPLKYEYVHKLVQDFPQLQFTINGGFLSVKDSLNEVINHGVHGVMVGRAVVNYPFHWRHIDSLLYNQPDQRLTRREILHYYADYAKSAEAMSGKRERRVIIKPIFNLFHSEMNGKMFRFELDRMLVEDTMSIDSIIMTAMKVIPDHVLDKFDEESLVVRSSSPSQLVSNCA